MSIWHWVHEFRRDAEERGDAERLRMTFLLQDAGLFFETDPDRALALLAEGRRQAQALGEPRWALFYDHWRLQVMIHHKGDFRYLLDDAVRATVEASRPQFADFPQRVCLQEDLITVYVRTDPVGHAEQIEQALAYMRREVRQDMECRHCVSGCRFRFEMGRGRVLEAREEAFRGLALAEDAGNDHQIASACAHLCAAFGQTRDYAAAGEFADAGAPAARRADRKGHVALFLAWQAVARRHARENDEAARLFRAALTRAARLQEAPSEDFFNAQCAYHEVGGDAEQALAVRERQLAEVTGRGELAHECRAHLARCRLLAGLERLTAADLDAARAAARRLKQPAPHLAEIDRIGQQAAG